MKFSAFCIKRKVTTFMIYVGIVIFGLMSYMNLALDLMPNMEIPVAIVQTVYGGAAPEEIESMVTEPLEKSLARISGIKTLSSRSQENVSLVIVQFNDGVNMDTALTDMREKADQVKSQLPDGCDTPMVMKLDPDAMPVMVLSIGGNDDLAAMQTLVEDTISPQIERIEGVASVEVMGGYTKEVHIETYPDRLRGYNLSVAYIAQMLQAENISIPSGEIQNGAKTLNVRTTGEFKDINDIRNVLIPLPAGGTVRLSEIADVSMGYKDVENIAKVDGQNCIALTVSKQSGVNTVKVAETIQKQIERIRIDQPHLTISAIMDQSDYINQSVDSVLQNVLIGVVLAAIILLIFLRDFGATIVISLSMPICIICTFLLMNGMGLTLNLMTLGGMGVGVGMIVDNSVVVLENIFTYRRDGKSRYESCIYGAGEVSLSISAGTLTTVAVFLPVALTGGMVGMMFREFSLTIVSLLLSSLFIALTLVPLLCYITMDRGGKRKVHPPKEAKKTSEEEKLSFGMRIYRGVLKLAVCHRWIATAVSIAFTVGLLSMVGACGFVLTPDMDQGEVSIAVDMPLGSEVSETEAIADRIVSLIIDTPEIHDLFYTADKSSASVTVNMVDLNERERSSNEIADEFRQKLSLVAGADISISATSSSMGGSGSAIDIQIKGSDYDELTRISKELADKIALLPGAREVKSSASDRVPQVLVTLNRENAARFGLTAASIGQAVRGQLDGVTSTTLKMNGDEIDVIVKGDALTATSIDSMKAMAIPTQTGGSVPLNVVANVTTGLGPTTINRENQIRTLSVTGDVYGTDISTMTQEVQKVIDSYMLPDGYTASIGGESEDMAETFGSLLTALIVAMLLVYFILASQFESLMLPFIIMLILPIGIFGGLAGLTVFGMPISMPVFIGVIVLAGSIVNAPIVLIDYIQIRRRNGQPKLDAILDACPRRVRPVMMTTLTTILGLVPMAIGLGEGSEMMRPMAVVMIAGYVIALVGTLLFTPVYYSILDSLSNIFRRKENRDKPKDTRTPEQKEQQEALSVPGIDA